MSHKMSSKVLVAATLLTISAIGVAGFAQEREAGRASSPSDSIETLRVELEQKRAERASLERMVAALNSVDSVYKIHYPTWLVLDEDLRQRIIRSFRTRNASLAGDPTVTVVASPGRSEIVEISIGSAAMGRLEVNRQLSDSLRKAILGADYLLREIDAVPKNPRPGTPFGTLPRVVSIDASLFRSQLLFSNGWGVEARLGHDEIGYPFWLTGSYRVFAILNQLKIGIVVPIYFGQRAPSILGPLDLRPRRLNGATGFSAEFDQPVNDDLLSARFTVGELTKFNYGQLTDDLHPYYLHTVAQLLYSWNKSFGNGEHRFTFIGGLGFHQIALGEVQNFSKIVAIKKTNFGGPILRVEYAHYGSRIYGLGFQFYSSVVELDGWLELLRNFLYVELRYSAPVLRDPKPWEQPYFVLVSPRFRLSF
jgi:hypothetical protein